MQRKRQTSGHSAPQALPDFLHLVPWAPIKRILVTSLILFALVGGAAPRTSRADEDWQDSSDSGVETDEGLPPLPKSPYSMHLKSSPSGYDEERIRRFWRKYRVQRPEKAEPPPKLYQE